MPTLHPVFVSSFRVCALLAASIGALACVSSRSAQTGERVGDTAPIPMPRSAHPRELILAGGSLKLCSSLATKDCTLDAAARINVPQTRGASRYGLDAAVVGDAFEAALDPGLWAGREAMRAPMRALLTDTRGKFAGMALDEDTLRDYFESRCVSARGQLRGCRGTARSPWLRLDDEQQSAVLAALELPQRDAQGRKRERAALDGGRRPYGAQILRAFVAAARQRVPGDGSSADDATRRPRIAVVTASAFDPFDPVDMYLDVLRQAGADVEWWPVDAALATAVFEGAGCEMLPALRLSMLKLPGRERVFPDLAAQQAHACMQPEALRTLPDRVQGVFFTGGDQWKLRKAFFHRDDAPNAWLLALRAAVARGEVVIGGTSAGSAVQSGGPMLSNGTPAWAVEHGAVASPPPVPGCMRSGDCVGGLDEDAFTFWPAGGLGLAPGIIVDTHFSERARELRLLRLLADTGTRLGIGIDETSALHLRWRSGKTSERDRREVNVIDNAQIDDTLIEISAIGAEGGWVFDAGDAPRKAPVMRALGWYLAPGSRLRWTMREKTLSVEPSVRSDRGATPPLLPKSALDDGALRSVAQTLAAAGGVGHSQTLPATGTSARVTMSATGAVIVPAADDAGMRSIGPLVIELQP
jgi:hypothetical protein